MAFMEKQDYFGIADGTSLVCISSNDGASASVAEAKGADGSIVAHEVFGHTEAPSCDYRVKGAKTNASTAPLKLGAVTAVDSKSYCLNNIAISTSGGSEPSVSASGEQVEAGAAVGCTYSIPAFTLEKAHHAQILMSAFTLGGDGCHLTKADYTCSASLGKATKDGVCLAFDVTEGKVEASVDIVQTGSAKPTVTAGDGWSVTAPLALTNPDADYPTWSCTLTKYLAKD